MAEIAGPAGPPRSGKARAQRRRPALVRLPEARLHAMQEEFARLGLAPQAPRVTPESLHNVAVALFRVEGRIVATRWADDLTEIADPAFREAFDIVALEQAADVADLGGPGRIDWLVGSIAAALRSACSARGLPAEVVVERFADPTTAPTWRDYLEGRLFSRADYHAGRRAMRLLPPDPAAAAGGGRLDRLYSLQQIDWTGDARKDR